MYTVYIYILPVPYMDPMDWGGVGIGCVCAPLMEP